MQMITSYAISSRCRMVHSSEIKPLSGSGCARVRRQWAGAVRACCVVVRAGPHVRAGIQALGSMPQPQRSLGGRGLQFELDRLECFERQINYMSKEA